MSIRSASWLSAGAEELALRLQAPQRPPVDCDVLVIGSGYGGAVAAARLAGATAFNADGTERGPAEVWLLERGAEHLPGRFASRFSELPGHVRFSRQDGRPPSGRAEALLDVRLGPDVNVLLGNGLGGGSLINAGVMARPEPDVFESGWPTGIDDATMAPWFERAWCMLAPQQVPRERETTKLQVLDELVGSQATRCRVTVNFALAPQPTPAGVSLASCTRCGDCLTGCNQGAKGSLDTNYLALARQRGATLFCGGVVHSLKREDDHWLVHWHYTEPSLRPNDGQPFTLRARQVVLAAGSLGSTEILLRSRTQLALSSRLGDGFSANGDCIAARAEHAAPVGAAADPMADPADDAARRVGPTITGLFKVPPGDGADEPGFVIEEFGVPGALRQVFGEIVTSLTSLSRLEAPLVGARHDPLAVTEDAIDRMSLYGLMGDDGGGGVMTLPPQAPEDAALEAGVRVEWADLAALPLFSRMRRWLADKDPEVGGIAVPGGQGLSAAIAGSVAITVHPLGGCRMADSAATGVVDAAGRVFDGNGGVHPGLAVLDGSIVPRALAINPALTITALAERALPELMHVWGLADGRPTATPLAPRPLARRQELPPGDTVWTLRERLQGPMRLGARHFWARLEIEFDEIPGFRKALALQRRVLGVRLATLRLWPATADDDEFSFDDSADVDHTAVCMAQLAGQVELFAPMPPHLVPGAIDARVRLIYQLSVQGTSGERIGALAVGSRLDGLKVFGIEPGVDVDDHVSVWRQLSEMDVALNGQPVGRWRLDLGDLARRRDPLLSIAHLQTMPDALADLAALGLYTLRLALPTLVEQLGSAQPSPPAHQLDQRWPGDVDGVPPEVFNPRGCASWRLSRYTGSGRPVVLIHGLGTSGSSFTLAAIPTSLVQALRKNNRDVWVLDLRSSSANEAGRALPESSAWTVESIGREDIPAALRFVVDRSGQPQVDVIAHCMGAVMFCLAVLGEPALQGVVRAAVLSQVGPLARLSALNRLRGFVASYLQVFFGVEELDATPDWHSTLADPCRPAWQPIKRGLAGVLSNALMATFPYPDGDPQKEHQRSDRPPLAGTDFRNVRHRADAIFGQLFELDNLSADTLAHLDALFGWAKTPMLGQAIHFARHNMLTGARGRNELMRLANFRQRFDFPVLMVHGRRNRVFDWRGSLRSLRLLQRLRGEDRDRPPTDDPARGCLHHGRGTRTQLAVFTDYGHLDCLIGRDAARDVFPVAFEFLGCDWSAVRAPNPPDRLERESEAPWIGPMLGWMRQGRGPGPRGWLSARVLVHTPQRRALTHGVALVPVRRTVDGTRAIIGAARWLAWPGTDRRHAALDLTLDIAALQRFGDTFALLTLHRDLPYAELYTGVLEIGDDDDWLLGSRRLAPAVGRDIEAWIERHRPDGEFEASLFSLSEQVVQALDWQGASVSPAPPLTFALASCQYPPGLFDRAPADATWRRLLADAQHGHPGLGAPQFLLLAGDQVYVDEAAGAFDPGDAQGSHPHQRKAAFDRSYELNWRLPAFRRLAARLPLYTMLDDHEVGDNWKGLHAAPVSDAVRLALQAFDEFQAPLAPDTRLVAGDRSFKLCPGGVPLFVIDTRSTREPRDMATIQSARIIAPTVMAALIDGLRRAPREVVKLVLLPVPMLPPERFDPARPAERLRSDSGSGFPASRAELLCAIRDHDIRHVVLLSGDSHLSSVTRFTFEGGNGNSVISVVSSGSYAPWPFANQRPDELLLDGEVDVGTSARACSGRVELLALSSASGHALIDLRTEDRELTLRVSLRSAQAPDAQCRIVMPPAPARAAAFFTLESRMTPPLHFSGKITLYSTVNGFPGPKVVDGFRFAATMAADGAWTVARADFGEAGRFVMPDIDTPLGPQDLVVTLTQDASGASDPSSGSISLDARFNFKILGNSLLAVAFDIGKHSLDLPGAVIEGKPYDPATGTLSLAGGGTFVNGRLNGKRCLLLVEGRFVPNPWA